MEFYSLLDSYGYIVYENIKKKSFPKNIFSSDEKKIGQFLKAGTTVPIAFSRTFQSEMCISLKPLW